MGESVSHLHDVVHHNQASLTIKGMSIFTYVLYCKLLFKIPFHRKSNGQSINTEWGKREATDNKQTQIKRTTLLRSVILILQEREVLVFCWGRDEQRGK